MLKANRWIIIQRFDFKTSSSIIFILIYIFLQPLHESYAKHFLSDLNVILLIYQHIRFPEKIQQRIFHVYEHESRNKNYCITFMHECTSLTAHQLFLHWYETSICPGTYIKDDETHPLWFLIMQRDKIFLFYCVIFFIYLCLQIHIYADIYGLK